ncbi:hypothetical protein HUS23_00235 [Ectothiorhodospiraceae bacterium 2226]|nr:hypothetical protein HUS23_00235 [Ectothiorhodospiraceae bacterium 2226]
MPRSFIWLFGLLIVLMLGGLLGAWWLREQVPVHGKPLVEVEPVTAEACDLHRGPCRSAVDGGSVTLTLAPRPIRALQPLDIDVQVEGVPVQAAAVSFSGVDMYMGHNRVRLQSLGAGRYVGEGTLPVCVTGRMTWSAELILEGPDAVRVVPFHFDVEGR